MPSLTEGLPPGIIGRLHGLPAVKRNVTGATRDTDPVRALLAKERRNGC